MPFTNEVTAKMGPEGAPFGADNPGYGSLLFFLSEEDDHTYDDVLEPVDPSIGLVNDNFTEGFDGWATATSGATAVLENGELIITPAPAGTKFRGDIRRTAGATLYPANYPIVAIKMKKPAVCNLTFDTNLGAYGNGANKWTGKIGEDIYYYDLTKTGFGSGPIFLPTSSPTALPTFQFKIADMTSGDSYAIDWVKTVKSVNDLLAFEPTTGLIDDNFSSSTDGWSANTSGATVAAANGQLKVTLSQAGGKGRGDIKRSAGAMLYPANYPIIAIKLKQPAVVNITLDTNLGSFGNGSNKHTGKIGDNIYYYDMSKTGFGGSGALLSDPTFVQLFQFKVADITSGETSYLVDWVKTVKTVEELEQFVAPRYQTLTFQAITDKKVGDIFSPALASSGLAISYSSSNTSVATIVNGEVHVVGAGTAEITASQAGNSDFYAAEPLTQTFAAIQLPHSPYQGVASAVPGVVEAEDFDEGGQGIAYNDLTFDNVGGAYRPAEGVDIESISGGGYAVAKNQSGEWLKYTVRVIEAGEYTMNIRYASQTGNGKLNIKVEGEDATGTIVLPATGGMNSFGTVSASLALEPGLRVIGIYMEGDNFKLDKLTFALGGATLTATQSQNLETSESGHLFYPNPVADVLNISLSGVVVEGATISLYNANGKLMLSQRMQGAEQALDVKSLPRGIYFVKVQNGEQLVTQKVIKN